LDLAKKAKIRKGFLELDLPKLVRIFQDFWKKTAAGGTGFCASATVTVCIVPHSNAPVPCNPDPHRALKKCPLIICSLCDGIDKTTRADAMIHPESEIKTWSICFLRVGRLKQLGPEWQWIFNESINQPVE
jgi:hypothetical protein